MKQYIKIHPDDSVAVALFAGTPVQIDGTACTLIEDIPQGHKFALADIPAKQQIM